MRFHESVFARLAAWSPRRTRDESGITVTGLVLLRDYAADRAGVNKGAGALVYVSGATSREPRWPLWFGPKIPAEMDVEGATYTEVRLPNLDPVFIYEAPDTVPRFEQDGGGPGGEAEQARVHLAVGEMLGRALEDREMSFLVMGG